MKECDVVVIGAGPAGCHCARVLAKNGVKVVLLEKEKEIGEPNFSTAGTPAETLDLFDLPKEVAPYHWNKLSFESPGVKVKKKLDKFGGYVLDFRKFRQWIAEQVADEGGEIVVGVEVEEPIFENRKIIGVRYRSVVKNDELRAKIIVDATGSRRFLVNQMDLVDHESDVSAVGIELEMANVALPESNILYFWAGSKFVPNGYAWVFPLSETVAKVGIARLVTSEKKIDIKKTLNEFIKIIPWLSKAEPLEFHAGTIVYNPKIKNFVKDNFVGIGTAVSHFNPLGGEGVRHGLQSAKLASEVILKALKEKDTSEKRLSEFNKLWLEYSKNWSDSILLSYIIYKKNSDQALDDWLNVMKNFSGDDWYKMYFHYDLKKYMIKFAALRGKEEIKNILKKLN